jgi:hypothetical protein
MSNVYFLVPETTESLLERVRKLKQQLADSRASIVRFNADVRANLAELFDQVETTGVEIQRQRAKSHAKPDFGDFISDILDESPSSTKEVSASVKSIYAKIANICHPDKTSNLQLHALFVSANKAKQADDLDILLTLYDQVLEALSDDNILSPDAAASVNIDGLAAQVDRLISELAQVLASREFHLATQYTENRQATLRLVEFNLKRQHLEMRNQLLQMELQNIQAEYTDVDQSITLNLSPN